MQVGKGGGEGSTTVNTTSIPEIFHVGERGGYLVSFTKDKWLLVDPPAFHKSMAGHIQSVIGSGVLHYILYTDQAVIGSDGHKWKERFPGKSLSDAFSHDSYPDESLHYEYGSNG